jgi:hypothetical protein
MLQRPQFVPNFIGLEAANAARQAAREAAALAEQDAAAPAPVPIPQIPPEEIKCEGDRLTVLRGAMAAANLLSDPDMADQAILEAYAAEGRVKVSARDEIEDLKAQVAALTALVSPPA